MLALELLQGRLHQQAFLKVWAQLRRQAAKRGCELLEHPTQSTSGLSLEWLDFLEEVLNEKEQWCVMMRLNSIKWEDIGQTLNCSGRTCQRIHETAIKKLRRRLDAEDGSD